MAGSIRPYLETQTTALVSGDKVIVDSAARGTQQIDYDNLSTQFEITARKAQANGYASLDSTGKVPAAQLRSPYTIEEVANAAARNALTVITAEIAVRQVRLQDTGVIYVPNAAGTGAGIWVEFNSVGAATTSAAGIVELATSAEAATGTDTTRAVTPTALKAGMADEINSRGQMQGIVLAGSGASSGAGVSLAAFGTSDFSIEAWAQRNETGRTAVMVAGASGSPEFFQAAGGAIYLSKRSAGAISLSDLDMSKRRHMVWTRSNGTSKLYVDGVEVLSGADTQDYTAPISTIGAEGPGDVWDGFLSVTVFNRCLTAAQVQSLWKHGVDALDRPSQIAGTNLVTGDDSTFASDTGFWTKGAGVTINNASDGVCTIPAGVSIRKTGLTARYGSRYRVAGTVVSIGTGTLRYANETEVPTPLVTASGDFAIDVTDGSASGNFNIDFQGTGSAVIDNVTVIPLGAVLLPEPDAPGNGLVWNDVSGNGAHIVLPTSGVSWAKPSNAANRIRGTTSTNGNQKLLGAEVTRAGTNFLRVRARSRTGTPTVKLDNVSGGGDIVAAVALSTAWQELTLLYKIESLDRNLWVNSNSTDVVEWDIAWEPLSF